MKVSVIITTYNQPQYLKLCLLSYQIQHTLPYEILIADDGSTEETAKLIQDFKAQVPFIVKHVWHEDAGFRKTQILNKAIVESTGEYLLFTDGDCVARKDFISTHIDKSEKGRYLSGGYYKLSKKLTGEITPETIKSQACFSIKWLVNKGLGISLKNLKLNRNKQLADILNKVSPTKPTFNGHGSSGFRKDFIAVNGYDERMQYGGLDCEIGERLVNYGVKGKRIRFSTTCLHLWHKRGYMNQEGWDRNNAIREQTRTSGEYSTTFGIHKQDKSIT